MAKIVIKSKKTSIYLVFFSNCRILDFSFIQNCLNNRKTTPLDSGIAKKLDDWG